MHLLVGVAPTVVAEFHRLDRLLKQLGDECVARRATTEIEETLQRCRKKGVTTESRARLLRDVAKRLSRAAELMADCEALAKNDAQLWRRVQATTGRIISALRKKKERASQVLTRLQSKMSGCKRKRVDSVVTLEAKGAQVLVPRAYAGRRTPRTERVSELVS